MCIENRVQSAVHSYFDIFDVNNAGRGVATNFGYTTKLGVSQEYSNCMHSKHKEPLTQALRLTTCSVVATSSITLKYYL